MPSLIRPHNTAQYELPCSDGTNLTMRQYGHHCAAFVSAGKGCSTQRGGVPCWAPQEGMTCSHLCFPPPTQLPGPEAKLFVEMASVAVRQFSPHPMMPYIDMQVGPSAEGCF